MSGMTKKYGYPLAFLFVLFVIVTDPSSSGAAANQFAGFVGTLLSAAGDFFSALLKVS